MSKMTVTEDPCELNPWVAVRHSFGSSTLGGETVVDSRSGSGGTTPTAEPTRSGVDPRDRGEGESPPLVGKGGSVWTSKPFLSSFLRQKSDSRRRQSFPNFLSLRFQLPSTSFPFGVFCPCHPIRRDTGRPCVSVFCTSTGPARR